MLAAGGCCALQFTSGVSGLCIHAALRDDLIDEVDVAAVYVYIHVCLFVSSGADLNVIVSAFEIL